MYVWTKFADTRTAHSELLDWLSMALATCYRRLIDVDHHGRPAILPSRPRLSIYDASYLWLARQLESRARNT